MKEDRNEIGDKKSFFSFIKHRNTLKIERKVDRVLLENKDKLNEIDWKSLDTKKFSIENKERKSIYFVREKPLKTNEKEKESDEKSKKNKARIRIRFGKNKTEILDKKTPFNDSEKKKNDKGVNTTKPTKKSFYFEKKKTTITEKEKNKDIDRSFSDNLVELKKKYEEHIIFSGIDPFGTQETVKDETRPSDESKKKKSFFWRKESPKIEEISEDEEAIEISKPITIDVSPAKEDTEHVFFDEIDVSSIGWGPRITVKKKKDKKGGYPSLFPQDKLVNLAELKKRYEKHLTPSDIDKAMVSDEEIDKLLASKYDGHAGKTKIGEYKKKKFFLSKEKPSEIKKTEDTKEETKPKKSPRRTIFPNEKLSEDETKFLDEKIEKTPITSNLDEEKNEAELKAIKLAEEHIKDKTVSAEGETHISTDETSPGGEKLEHVFFDETDTSEGWMVETTDGKKGTRDISLSVPTHTEIKPEDVKKNDEIDLPKDVLHNRSLKLEELGFSEKEWEELDFYALRQPFSYAEILREKESLDKSYFLVEVELTQDELMMLEFITETLNRLTIDSGELESKGDEKYLMWRVEQIIDDYDIKLEGESKNKILYYIEKVAFGLDKIDPLMKDPNIEDISCDGANVPLFLYHRKYGSLKSNIEFKNEEELSSFIFKLAQKCGKHISIAEPMLDATMPDGSRIQMTLSDEITAKGSTFTIRKFREDPFSPPDLVEFNTMSSEMIAYFWLAVENGVNALIAGGTASGKTTILNALSLFIPREAKIVSIEETREINLPHPNWIPGVARSGFGEIVADRMVGEIDMYDLMKAALRQRPEYIIVGEIRGKEAYVLFQAMATGHATYSTVHADSAKSLIHRLEGKPIEIPRVMLQALDIVSIQITTRVKGRRVRRCKQIIEIIDIDPTTKEILTNEVFRWDPVEDKFVYTGKSYVLEGIRARWELDKEEMTMEVRRRAEVLEWMRDTNIRSFKEVAKAISRYTENPEDFMKKIRQEEKKNKKEDRQEVKKRQGRDKDASK